MKTIPSTLALIEIVKERSENPASCQPELLANCSIEQIACLHRYGLLDKLTELPGVGIDEILDIEEILDDTMDALPAERNWIYRLTLQVIRRSKLSTILQLLPKLKDISSKDYATIKKVFETQFSQSEKVVLYRHHRNEQPLDEIASNFGVSLSTVQRAQRNLMQHLRREQIQHMLVNAIFKD